MCHPGGAPGTLTRGGSKPSCLELPEFTPGSEAPADLLRSAPDQSEEKRTRFVGQWKWCSALCIGK